VQRTLGKSRNPRLHFLQVIGPTNVYKCVTQRPPAPTTMQAIKHEIFRLEMQLLYSKQTLPRDEGYVPGKPLLEQLLAKQQELFAAQSDIVKALRERMRALFLSKKPHAFERQMNLELDALFREDRKKYLSLVYMQTNIDETKRLLDACRHLTSKEWLAMSDKRRCKRQTKKTLLDACLKLEEWLCEPFRRPRKTIFGAPMWRDESGYEEGASEQEDQRSSIEEPFRRRSRETIFGAPMWRDESGASEQEDQRSSIEERFRRRPRETIFGAPMWCDEEADDEGN